MGAAITTEEQLSETSSPEALSSADGQFPLQAFVCPITQEVMLDPVTDRDGITYEKAAIEAWLLTSHTSPVTRKPLTAEQLVPNRALKDAINAFAKPTLTPPLIPMPAPIPLLTSSSAETTTESVEVFTTSTAAVIEHRQRDGSGGESAVDPTAATLVAGSGGEVVYNDGFRSYDAESFAQSFSFVVTTNSFDNHSGLQRETSHRLDDFIFCLETGRW